MNALLNKIVPYIKQHKYYIFLAIPFLLILLFMALTLALFQSPNTKDTNETTETIVPTKASFTSTPSHFTGTVTPTPEISPYTEAYIEIMRQQAQAEEEAAREQETIQQNYPWFNKLPLQEEQYFVYFDTEKKAFIGKLYPQSSIQVSVSNQTETLKAEVLIKLNSMGIPTSQYPIIWQVTPEP